MVSSDRMRLPIIALAPNEWRGTWWNRQHLLSRLAQRGWPVIYSTGVLSTWDRDKPKWKTSGWIGRFEEANSVKLDRPGRAAPRIPRLPVLDHLAIRHHANRLKKASSIFSKTNEFLLYIFHPSFQFYSDILRPRYVVFHAYDDYTRTPGWTPEMMVPLKRTIETSDLRIASSEAIARSLLRANDHPFRVLPNGVDESLFKPTIESECPFDLSMIPRPRIGYVGTVNEKFDAKLVTDVAVKRPDWHWVVIGPHKSPASGILYNSWNVLNSLPNVHFLGPKEMRYLPDYVNHMDINAICYRSDDRGWWAASDPLKCYEYLAVGRPIVSANLESVQRFQHVIDLVGTPDEWIMAIERALTSGGAGNPEQRRAVALENTWDKRVDQLEDWLFEMVDASRADK